MRGIKKKNVPVVIPPPINMKKTQRAGIVYNSLLYIAAFALDVHRASRRTAGSWKISWLLCVCMMYGT